MDCIKRKLKMNLESRKAALTEKLRHIDFLMDECVKNGNIAEYMELRKSYTHVRYQIDSIKCRLHNLTSSSSKYSVEERGMSSHFIVNL